MFVSMQIYQFPFLKGPGIPHQPRSGPHQQVNADLQVQVQAQTQAQAQTQTRGGTEAPWPAESAARGAGVAAAGSLDEAVRALADDGRLPRRGSLIDFKA